MVSTFTSRSSSKSKTHSAVICDNCSLCHFGMPNRKISLRAGIESTRRHPIKLRVRRLIHRTVPGCLSVFFCSCWLVQIVCNDGYSFFRSFAFVSSILLLCHKKFRCEQGSNLRGKTPLDFKSNALTTRPSQLW